MKYYLDTEFIEGPKHVRILGVKMPPWLFKPVNTIQLISIGIVCEDGREYYAISNEFNEKDANSWVKENVIAKLGDWRFAECGMTKIFVRHKRKSLAVIKKEIVEFLRCEWEWRAGGIGSYVFNGPKSHKPEFYAYYADYDWVVFCWIFGTMIQLPEGMPKYCNDLKQILVENGLTSSFVPHNENEHSALDDARWNQRLHRKIMDYEKTKDATER